jgi:hypothetical protein
MDFQQWRPGMILPPPKGERAKNLTEADIKCYDSWFDWQTSSLSFRKSHMTVFRNQTVTKAFLISKAIGEGTTYTACDGVPRFRLNSHPTSSTYSIASITYTGTSVSKLTWDDIAKEIPQPKCDIELKKCPLFDDRYRSERLKSGLDDFHYAKPEHSMFDALTPCLPTPSLCGIGMGSEVVLIYWPSRLHFRDICVNDGLGTAQTMRETETTPLVVTTDAITFSGFGVRPCVNLDCEVC